MSDQPYPGVFLLTYDKIYHDQGRVYTNSSFLLFAASLLKHHEPFLLCAPPAKPMAKHNGYSLDESRFQFLPLQAWRSGLVFYLISPYLCFRILRYIHKYQEQIDVIWLTSPDLVTYLVWRLTTMLWRIPHIFYLRGDAVKEFQMRNRHMPRKYVSLAYQGILEQRVRQMLHQIPSFTAGVALAEKYDLPKDRAIIANILSLSDYTPPSNKPTDCMRILTVCRLTRIKGIHILLDAIHRVVSGHQIALEACIIGDGNERKRLEAHARALGLERIVTFKGHISERSAILQHYREAHIFVLPSLSEGSPKVIPEAMSQGLPIIASNVGNISQMMIDGQMGWLVEPNDVDQLYTALVEGLSNHKARLQMAEASYQRAHQFAIESQREIFTKMIHRAI